MKTTENKETIKLVQECSHFNIALKEIGLAQSNLKAKLKMIMIDLKVKVLGVGNYVLVITDRSRMDLDKDKVKALLGDKYDSCLKKVDYQTFEIKEAFNK